MAILILKESGGWIRTPVPHAVWDGSMKDAKAWCEAKNMNPHNWRCIYSAVRIKELRRGEPR